MKNGLWTLLVLAFHVGLFSPIASAHPAASSAFLLDVGLDEIHAELQIPMDQLALATDLPVAQGGDGLIQVHASELRSYLMAHTRVTSSDGEAYEVLVEGLSAGDVDSTPHLIAEMVLTPPEGVTIEEFTLDYDGVLHRVVTHKIFVSMRYHFTQGATGENLKPLGVLAFQRGPLTVESGDVGLIPGLLAFARLGVHHIGSGADHLLFLFTLLLPLPLLPGSRSKPMTPSRTALAALRVVTAFTIGHSLTLGLSTIGVLELPAGPVEVFVALSIVVGSIAALFPRSPRLELLVPGAFGLIHGLAFSEILLGMGFGGQTLLASLLAFNTGIELAQLSVVAVVLPFLALLSRTRAYPWFRSGFALGAAGLALAWAISRGMGVEEPVPAIVPLLLGHLDLVAVGLILASGGLFIYLKLGRSLRRGASDFKGQGESHPSKAVS